MADAIKIDLGGQSWTVPPLAFGLIRKLQPRYLALVERAQQQKDGSFGFIADEKAIGEMAEIVREYIATVAAGMTAEAFEALPFTAVDLANAFRAMGAAFGLQEAGPGESSPATASLSAGTR